MKNRKYSLIIFIPESDHDKKILTKDELFNWTWKIEIDPLIGPLKIETDLLNSAFQTF